MLVEVLARKIAAGDVPPELRHGTIVARCGSCMHFDGVGECLKHGWPVSSSEVCDDFETEGGTDGAVE